MARTSNNLDEALVHLADGSLVTHAIVEGCQRGNSADQRTLYEAFFPKVHSLATRIVGRQEADDLTQQSFLQVFRRIGLFRGDSRFDTWLYRLVVNECLQYLRRRKATHASLEFEPMDHRSRDEESIDYREMLDMALARLDVDLRTLLVLREVEKLSYVEISEILSIAEGTVASRLNKARSLLKQHLIELGWEP